jgi:putative flippase GtrA
MFSYRIAYTGAFVLGIFISYGLNATFVFRAGIAVGSLIRFPLIYIVQYLLGIALISVLVDYVGVADWLAPVFVIMVTVPLTFVLARTIFLPKNKMELDDAG